MPRLWASRLLILLFGLAVSLLPSPASAATQMEGASVVTSCAYDSVLSVSPDNSAPQVRPVESSVAASSDSSAPFSPGGVAANSAKPFSRFAVNSAGETTMFMRAGNQSLEVTEHAAQRMTERGISIDAAESALQQKPFQHFHQDVWKTGYYDSGSKLFVGTVDGRVATLINGVSPKYIANLQAVTP